MAENDPLSPLLRDEEVSRLSGRAESTIAAAHRRPAALRKPEVVSSESLLRGARASAGLVSGRVARDVEEEFNAEDSLLARHISAYSTLAPEQFSATLRTFTRAPLQVLARWDVAGGGAGKPQAAAERLTVLAGWVVAGAGSAPGPGLRLLLPAVLHAEVAAHGCFGERSGLVGRMAGRAAAIATGLDPRGFAVPETYFLRHRQQYAETLQAYRAGDPFPLLRLHLAAWEAGGKEAEGIARAA